MPSHLRVDPPGVFTSLAEIAREASTPKEMYAAICVAATLTVPGCDHASLMICRDGVYSTAAVSDATARQIDKLELALGSGPCLDRDRRVHRTNSDRPDHGQSVAVVGEPRSR